MNTVSRCGLLDWSLVRMGALCRTWSLHPKTQAKLHHELLFFPSGQWINRHIEFSRVVKLMNSRNCCFLGQIDGARERELLFLQGFVGSGIEGELLTCECIYIANSCICLKPVIAKQIIPPKGIVISRKNIANSKATFDEKSETITTTNQQTGEYICLFYSPRWARQNSEFCVPVSLCLTSPGFPIEFFC